MPLTIGRTDALSLMRSLSGDAVQVIVADPPYGIAYHSNRHEGRNPHAPVANDWDFRIGEFLHEAARVLRPGGALYLFTRWDVYPSWVLEIPVVLKNKNLIVWVKDNWSAGDLEGDFGNQHEFIMMLTKGKHRRRGRRWSNVWSFPRVPAKSLLMPVQKPVELIRRAIEASSDEGDLVLDPFCGSGTTGEASTGRECLLGDIDPRMIRIACSRLGLKVPPECHEQEVYAVPACPVFQVEPPAPHLWGIHPEDLAHALGKEPAEEGPLGPFMV